MPELKDFKDNSVPEPDNWYEVWEDAWYPDRPTIIDLLRLAQVNEPLKQKLFDNPLQTVLDYDKTTMINIKNWLGTGWKADQDVPAVSNDEILEMLTKRLLTSMNPFCSGLLPGKEYKPPRFWDERKYEDLLERY